MKKIFFYENNHWLAQESISVPVLILVDDNTCNSYIVSNWKILKSNILHKHKQTVVILVTVKFLQENNWELSVSLRFL